METAEVRRRVVATIDGARRGAAARRARADEATGEYAAFLDSIATPLFRQVANVLKVNSYSFTVFTPGGSVRLMSDRNSQDFIELSLDTSGEEPVVMGRSSRTRGSRVVETERPIASGPVRDLGEEHVLRFVLEELAPLVER